MHRLPRRIGTLQGKRWIDKKESFHLYRFLETKVKRYTWKKKSNPYIEMKVWRTLDNPFTGEEWYGNAPRNADLQFQCFQRDSGMCQVCFRPKTNIEAHHIIPLSENGSDTLDNLVTLCEDCHSEYSWQEIRRLVESRVR